MTESIPPQIDDLLDRRATYVEWLERLDEVADQARPEVVERIRADYRDRLEDVRAELGEHREDLSDDLAARTDRVERLEEEREEKLALREEAEVRHEVGEFGEEEWESRRRELDRAIDDLDERLEGERQAISRLRSALDVMEEAHEPEGSDAGGAEAGPGGQEPEGAERPPLKLVDEEGVEGERHGESPTSAAEAEGPPAPEAEPPGVEERSAAEGSSADESGEPGDSDTGAYDELEFLESLSLDDADQFDAVSAMLDEGEEKAEGDGRSDEDGDAPPEDGDGSPGRDSSGGRGG